MSSAPHNVLPSYEPIPEPELQFHPDRETDADTHPLRGLLTYGPYSRGLPLTASDPIRLAVICPAESLEHCATLVNELRSRQAPRERKQYLVDFPGMSQVFGVGLDLPRDPTDPRVGRLSQSELSAAMRETKPHERLAELLHRALRRMTMVRAQFDVLLLYLPEDLTPGFLSPKEDELSDFDLHDSVKALCSSLQVPLQVLNEDAFSYFCRCSVAWRLSMALYVKAGGVPWKLRGFEDRHAYVGLSYCLRKSSRTNFVTCCSQLFDAGGTNLQFILYETQDGRYEGDNPYLPRGEMYRVMARTMALYQKQKGQVPTRLVVHKTTHFTDQERDGCNDALGSVDDLELLTVTQTSPWHGVRIDAPRNTNKTKGTPASYPLERGASLPIGFYDYLLWTQGVCRSVGNGRFFKEGKGIPRPLVITRHQGRGGSHEGAREILGLTKMNWNNDSLYDRIPATISYASILARVVKRMGSLSQIPYDFRYFM
jgi:hypothetical protein